VAKLCRVTLGYDLLILKIGLFTDLHYADGVRENSRYCHLGLMKLAAALRRFRKEKVDLVVGLGDLVDSCPTMGEEYARLVQVRQLIEAAGIPYRLLPGNHCVWTLDKTQYLNATGQTATWGAMSLDGFRLIFLDGCFRKDGVAYGQRNNDWRDASISSEQMEWLGSELQNQTPTILFVHQRLDVPPPFGVENSADLREMFRRADCVKAVFQGHEHAGARTVIDSIRYRTLPAMVEGDGISTAPIAIVQTRGNSVHWLIGTAEGVLAEES
jgi:3',5'-cyclic AMP phosphodiesterase CpdA